MVARHRPSLAFPAELYLFVCLLASQEVSLSLHWLVLVSRHARSDDWPGAGGPPGHGRPLPVFAQHWLVYRADLGRQRPFVLACAAVRERCFEVAIVQARNHLFFFRSCRRRVARLPDRKSTRLN